MARPGIGRAKLRTGIRPKSLMGPTRSAMRVACVDQLGLITARGQYRGTRPNPLPESARRPLRHAPTSTLFTCALQLRYYAAIDEIRERYSHVTLPDQAMDARYLSDARPAPRLIAGRLRWASPTRSASRPAACGRSHVPAASALPCPISARTISRRSRSELPKQIILGWSPSGICLECGEGRRQRCLRDQASSDRKGP